MHNITTPSQQPGTHRGQDRRFQPVLDTAPAAGSRGRTHERALGLLSLAVSPLVSPLATTSVTSSLKFVAIYRQTNVGGIFRGAPCAFTSQRNTVTSDDLT